MSAGLVVAPLYRGWELVNEALVEAIAPLSSDQLRLAVGSPKRPIWAVAAHIAGTRVYWLCNVFGEPGIEDTPFAGLDVANAGWEDDLAHPRTQAELVEALASTWRIVERCLESWTPEALSVEARRIRGDVVQVHTRQSVLIRMITHDAFHCGELALALGAAGVVGGPNGPIDMWSGLSRIER